MPGLVIHLAIGKVYEQNNKIEDINIFEKGIVDPDLNKNKAESHYRQNSEDPDLKAFIKEKGISDNYSEGYFLHLVADYLFYKDFLENYTADIYDDYDKLNDEMVQKFKVVIPKEMQGIVKSKEGELTILNKKRVYKFIDIVGKINIRKIISENNDCEKQIEKEFLKELDKN